MGHPSIWTPPVDNTVQTAWALGIYASDIAALVLKEHGIHVTRNAIIGRAGRKKWVTPNKPVPIADTYKREARAAQRVRLKTGDARPNGVDGGLVARVQKAPRPPRFPKDNRPRPTITDNTGRLMTLLELEPNQCRYPTSPDDATSHLFCGAPQEDGPYCGQHASICTRKAGGTYGHKSPGFFTPRMLAMTDGTVDAMDESGIADIIDTQVLPEIEQREQQEVDLPHGKTFSEHSGSSA